MCPRFPLRLSLACSRTLAFTRNLHFETRRRRIYKDIFTGEEVLCDQDRPVEELDDIVYTRRGTLITIGGEDFSAAIGANAAAGGGEADEEAEPDAGSAVTDKVQVIDIVHNNRLTKVDYSKDEYKAHIKEYLKKMVEYLKENKPDRVDAFKKGAAAFVQTKARRPPAPPPRVSHHVLLLCR